MKIVVLLVLIGLASCHSALIGRTYDQDVEVEYSFNDHTGRGVNVEVEHDSRPTFQRVLTPVAPAHIPVECLRYVVGPVPAPAPVPVIKQDLWKEPEPEPKLVYNRSQAIPVVAPQPVMKQFIQGEAPKRPEVTQYVHTQQVPVSRPAVLQDSRQVVPAPTSAPAPAPAPVPVVKQDVRREPEPEAKLFYDQSQAIPVVASLPVMKQFNQVEAPKRPEVTQYVYTQQVPVSRPVVLQDSRQMVPAPTPAPVPVIKQYIRREPEPEPKLVYSQSQAVPVVAPQPVVKQFIKVEAPKRPVVTQYVHTQPLPVSRPVVYQGTRQVVPVQVGVPRRHTVKVSYDDDDDDDEDKSFEK